MTKRKKPSRANGSHLTPVPETHKAVEEPLPPVVQPAEEVPPAVRKFTGNIYIEVRDNNIRYKVESLGKPTFGEIKNVFEFLAKHQDDRFAQRCHELGAVFYVEDPGMWADKNLPPLQK